VLLANIYRKDIWKKFNLAKRGAFYQKRGIFVNFQCLISLLSLMIELRLSLQTYRNSYLVHPKKLFSTTLNLHIKVKWHMCLALPYFHQKGQQDYLQIPSKLPRIHGVLL